MVDDISRQALLGWGVLGEWIILYAFLFIQLLYHVLILRRLWGARMPHGSEANGYSCKKPLSA
ncbi:MAG: hypothetical protein V1800_02425 [Candidatus Latescibacterota bacterium]